MNFQLRRRATRIVDRTGVASALFSLRRLMPLRWLTVVAWHRVDEPGSADDVDDDVLDATPAEFAAQVDVLAKHFNVVRLADVVNALSGAPLPPNPALLTFDDGYLDGTRHALPVLQRKGVPATFFLATAPIANRSPFWWDTIAWIVKHARRSEAHLPAHELRLDIHRAGRAAVTRACLELVKTRVGLDVDRFTDALSTALDAPWDESAKRSIADRLLMTWDDVRVLARGGMEIGSHTRTHRVLHTLNDAELESELSGARDDIAHELGAAPIALAYPVGKPVSHLPSVRRALDHAGYELAFTYLTGFQRLGGPIDRFSLRRIAIDRNTTRGQLECRLATLGLLG